MDDYGLIIIDDEQMMRDGLSSFINWEDMGFHLDGIFNDGRDAIDWLGSNDTHVILTDLRMPHASGLDVTAFVRDKGLNIKIVIISGYSDFEAAREAMGYRVSRYLMKPVSLKEVRETFKSLKEELDTENHSRTLVLSEIDFFESLRLYAEEQFVHNLITGKLFRRQELLQHLKLINRGNEILENSCILLSLDVMDNSEYAIEKRDHLLGGIICREFSSAWFYWYESSENAITGIIFGCGDFSDLQKYVRELGELTARQAAAMRLKVKFRYITAYETLESLAYSRKENKDDVEWAGENADESSLPVSKEPSSKNISRIQKARQYIEFNFKNDIKLTVLASHVNLSPVYLSRLFKEQMGMNFSQYLIHCRMAEACRLLKTTDHKIYRICEEVGYSDVKHFYVLFKKQIGSTPSEYRNGH